MDGAAASRRAEFAAGRRCAHEAMTGLGEPAMAVGRGPDRAPQWPPGLVGSITHCQGLAAAVVARQHRVLSLGVDVELNAPLPGETASLVMTDQELLMGSATGDALRAGGVAVVRGLRIHTDRLIFSAKESVFKAWSPLTAAWLDFTDCSVAMDLKRGTFTADIHVQAPTVKGVSLKRFTGRWVACNDHLLTAVEVNTVTTAQNGSSLTGLSRC